jgi:hypothetical protein
MRAFGNTAGFGLTYLTAIVTLFAGFPHVECRCPNGQIKLFCFGEASAASGTGCCRDPGSVAAGPVKHGSCCGHCHGGPPGDAPFHHSHVQAAGCTKVLAQAEVFALSSGKIVVRDVAVVSAHFVSASPALLLALPAAGQRQISYSFHLLAPPTDLVVRLQRLLI